MRKTAILLLASLILIGTASAQQTTNSSENGLAPGLTPASPFYGVEMFAENLEVKLAGVIGGDDMKAKALANNAEERVSEAQTLIERNKSDKAAEAIDRYSKTLNRSVELAGKGQDEQLKQKINNISNKNVETLKEVKEKVPEQAKGAIEKAINQSEKRRQGPPSEALNKSEIPVTGRNQTGKPENTGRPNLNNGENRNPENLTQGQKPDLDNRSVEETVDKAENKASSVKDSEAPVSSDENVDKNRPEPQNNKITENNSLTDLR
ncbi:DUF5667 domain-containing protein [Candidatus Nanohalovita haloferacivicina]|uniref:DUF5667 domain-containing protein n=1 Tax=Candidatus Nanohalovita haloferacivicina TaxID=2978046 RepID=UPI00325F9E97|nr:Uncharacterized protein HBNXNv_0058 [Candidatus Nanohalobia archaeon BNXNv]